MIDSTQGGGHAAGSAEVTTALSDERETNAGAALGPVVPPELIPVIIQPARGKPAPLWQSVGVAVIFVALLSAIVGGIWWANDRWGTNAQVAVAAQAFEGIARGDVAAVRALISADATPGLTQATADALRTGGIDASFAPLAFDADGVGSTTAKANGMSSRVVFTPDATDGSLVDVAITGTLFGTGGGTIQLTRTGEGWRLVGWRFRPAKR
jgi:hypothetical protein